MHDGSGTWVNRGAGGAAYDLLTAGALPYPFVTTPFPHFQANGVGRLHLPTPGPAFTQALHQHGAVYTLVFEGLLFPGDVDVMLSTGSWNNTPGVALYLGGTVLAFQVGDGDPPTGSCASGNSLCAGGPSAGLAATGSPILAAVSINEPQSTGLLYATGAVTSFASAYAAPSTSSPEHTFEIGGAPEDRLVSGSSVYRVRVYDVALTQADLDALLAASQAACPWW